MHYSSTIAPLNRSWRSLAAEVDDINSFFIASVLRDGYGLRYLLYARYKQ
jgi:hypothetical protein